MRSSIVGCLVAGFVASTEAHAQSLREEHFGTGSDEHFGASCAEVRDVDGDGIDDFLVRSPLVSTTLLDCGRATLFSGATGAVIRTHDGSTAGENFGTSVAAAGDVDGDGTPDYVVSAPRRSTSLTFVGEVVVYSGRTGSLIWSVFGPVANGVLGNSVAGVGDVDGDGKDDVIVGTRSDDAYV